jgi:hypothetical protein
MEQDTIIEGSPTMTPVNYNRSLVYLNLLERIRKAATGIDAVSRGLCESGTPAAVIINEVSMMIQDNRKAVVGLLGEDIVQAVEGLKLVHLKTTGL